MEVLEFLLIAFGCIIASSVLSRFMNDASLPLVQIALGFLMALIAPGVVEVQLSSELFLALFIAPLLFDEARRANRRQLWENAGSISSIAVALVVFTVLVVGFALNTVVPSIPLAAAFACAAALGPTDAAAVGALGSVVGLKERQEALLSGESLVNDASGVVSFQFAVAAAVTGSFSLLQASESFVVLFVGGLLFGAVVGGVAQGCMKAFQRFGYEDTITHVIYEVCTPFVVFLFAEWLGVSGILAVVACGLVMADEEPRLVSVIAARRQMVSNTFWKVIVFLINGMVFVMLGMQLPLALGPSLAESFPLPVLIGLVVMVTALIMACRFAWFCAMDLLRKDPSSNERGYRHLAESAKDALVMTLAGPKGAVTLSIIFTLPLTVASGEAFPQRDLLVFLTAGVILLTLVLANAALPKLAPGASGHDDHELELASVRVLERTLEELKRRLDSGKPAEYIPALRMTQAQYQARLARARESAGVCGERISRLSKRVLQVQQARADELQMDESNTLTESEELPYYAALRSIRASVGYQGSAATVGARFHGSVAKLRLFLRTFREERIEDERAATVYYDTCLFAIELERVAIAYLKRVSEEDAEMKRAACALISYHQAAMDSIWGRIRYGQGGSYEGSQGEIQMGPHRGLPKGMRNTFPQQFAEAQRYAKEVDANALIIELDCIRQMQEEGAISNGVASQLRRRVNALQAALDGS